MNKIRIFGAGALLKSGFIVLSSGRRYLSAHFGRWVTLEAIHINAGHHIKVFLPRDNRGIGELLWARGQHTGDSDVRVATDLTPIDLVALQIGGGARLPRYIYGVRGWRRRRRRRWLARS